MDQSRLLGKVAIITGASSGIGRATALLFARYKMRVALAGRNYSSLEEVASKAEDSGGQAIVIKTDVTDQNQVNNLVTKTVEKWGQIDILIANSGQYLRCPIAQLDIPILEQSMAVNFYGGVYAVLAALPYMLKQKSGHIVLVATFDVKKALPPDVPYVAAKSALSGFGEVLRQELYQTGVYSTVVFPGRVDTAMISNLKVPKISAKISPERVADSILKAILKRKKEVILPEQTLLLYYLNIFYPSFADFMARKLHLEGWNS
jgi:short-subunit dehydrogenase